MKEFIEKLIGRLEEKENETVLKAPNTSDISNAEYQKWMMKSYGFKESIEIVNELAEEYNNGWISCKERLPEKYCHCLVTRRNDYEDGFDTDVREDCFIELEGVWDWQSTFEGLVDNIIAWQPLPQPYTEQQKPTWKKQTMNRFERVE